MSESRLNIELFKKIRAKIIQVPVAYDQSVYARHEDAAPCGTAACIAGWACVLSGAMDTVELRRRERSNLEEFATIEITAREQLGLASDEAATLFTETPAGTRQDWYEDDERDDAWPAPFAKQWEDAEITSAEIAVSYLDHIIETGKVLE